MKTPVILLAGYLGSGKTTLLKYVLAHSRRSIAVIMNEFGEVGIDTQTIERKGLRIKELLDGCICCELTGALEEALASIVTMYHPDVIVVETTGIAEPDNVVTAISKDLPLVRLASVVTLADADGLVSFPQVSNSEVLQLASASLIVLNKVDLVNAQGLALAQKKIAAINSKARVVQTSFGVVNPRTILASRIIQKTTPKKHTHSGYERLVLTIPPMSTSQLESFLKRIPSQVIRAKGYLLIDNRVCLVNFVRGKFSIEEAHNKKLSDMVVIGSQIKHLREQLESYVRAALVG